MSHAGATGGGRNTLTPLPLCHCTEAETQRPVSQPLAVQISRCSAFTFTHSLTHYSLLYRYSQPPSLTPVGCYAMLCYYNTTRNADDRFTPQNLAVQISRCSAFTFTHSLTHYSLLYRYSQPPSLTPVGCYAMLCYYNTTRNADDRFTPQKTKRTSVSLRPCTNTQQHCDTHTHRRRGEV